MQSRKTLPVSDCIISQIEENIDIIKYNHGGFTPENLLSIVTHIMSFIGQYRKLSGMQKKETVIDLVNKSIINDMNINTELRDLLISLVQLIVPNTIDLIVDISNKKYNFKHLPKFTCF